MTDDEKVVRVLAELAAHFEAGDSALPLDRVHWIAQDYTGTWYGYENEPSFCGQRWGDSTFNYCALYRAKERLPNYDTFKLKVG